MKEICHVWSQGRYISPSQLPGHRYLKLGAKSDHQAEISGEIVRYDAPAQRPEVVLRKYCAQFLVFYANSAMVFCASDSFLKMIRERNCDGFLAYCQKNRGSLS